MPEQPQESFIKDLPEILNANDLYPSHLEVEDGTGAQPVNRKVGFGTLVTGIVNALPGANASKTLYKAVRCYSRTTPGYNPSSNDTLEDLDEDFLALGALCYVEFPLPSREYRLVYSPVGPLTAWIDGGFRNERITAKWVERGSLEDKNAGIQDFIPFALQYASGDVVKFTLGGVLRLFSAKQDLIKASFPDQLIPEPSGLSTDVYWEEINGAGLTTITSWLRGDYHADEVVVYNSQLLRAKRAFTSLAAPTAGADWEVLAGAGGGLNYDDTELRGRVGQVEQDAQQLRTDLNQAEAQLNARIDALVTAAPAWQAGGYVQGQFIFNGGNVFVAKQDIANSTVAPTSTNVYWLQVNGTSPGDGTSYDDTQLRSLINAKVDKVTGKGLSTNDFTDAEKAKLAGLQNTPAYVLPTATPTTLGGVKVGVGLAMAGDGTLSATGAGTPTSTLYAGPGSATDGAMTQAAATTVDQDLQQQIDTVVSDLDFAENEIVDLQLEVDRRVLKVVGKQLSDQNFTLAEKQKLADLHQDPSLFKGMYSPTVVYAQGEFVAARNALYVSQLDGNVGYDVDFPDDNGTTWWTPVLKQNPDEVGLAYALLYAQGNSIVLETDKGVYSVSVPETYNDAPLRAALETKVDKVAGKQLTTEDFTPALRTKLEGLQNAPAYNDGPLVARVSTLETGKVDQVAGKQLTDVNFSAADKTRLDGLNGLTNAYVSGGNNLVLQTTGPSFTVPLPTSTTTGSGTVINNEIKAFSTVLAGGSKVVVLPASTKQLLDLHTTFYASLSPDDYTLDLASTPQTLTIQNPAIGDGDKVWGNVVLLNEGTITPATSAALDAKVDKAAGYSLMSDAEHSKLTKALVNDQVIPSTVLPTINLPGFTEGTLVGGVQNYTLDGPTFWTLIKGQLQLLPGYVGDGSKVLSDTFTWVTATTGTGGGGTTPPVSSTATEITTWPVVQNATFSGGTFTITNSSLTASGTSDRKLTATGAGSMQGVSNGTWLAFGTDGAYAPNGIGDNRFGMKMQPGQNKIILFWASDPSGQKYYSDEVQGRPASTILRLRGTNGAWFPEYSLDNGSTWSLVSIPGISSFTRQGVDVYAKVVRDDTAATAATGLKHTDLV